APPRPPPTPRPPRHDGPVDRGALGADPREPNDREPKERDPDDLDPKERDPNDLDPDDRDPNDREPKLRDSKRGALPPLRPNDGRENPLPCENECPEPPPRVPLR